MAVNIGPKIGIDGEAQYRKEIQNIIQQTKTLKAEMTATESAFTKNTSAMEKVRAKSQALTAQITTQKQRVEQLKNMVAESSAKYGEADTKTLKWRQALAEATTELNNLEAELRDLPSEIELMGQSWEEAGQKITAVGDKISSLGDSLTKNVTAPIMAVGTAAVASFKSLDTGYDTIVKKTGATGEAFNDLKEQANDLFTSMNVSMDDVGAAIGEVNTRFGLTGDAAEDAARQFLEFAQVNGTDVSGSVDKVQSALAAFNMDASETGSILDVVTAAGQKYGISADTLTSNLTSNATAFQEMGLSAYQAVDFMGQLEVAGADSSTVISSMKKALKEATEEGIPFDQALSDLQNTILNGTDSMDGLSAAYDLFGKSGAAVYQAVANGQISFTDFADSADILNDSLGATAETYEATLDPIDQFKIALNGAKVAGASVGSTLLTMVTPAITKLSEIISKVSEWWEGLNEKQQKSIITIAGIVAAVGPVLSIGGRIISTVGTITSGIGKTIKIVNMIAPIMTGTVLPAIGTVLAAIAPALPIILGVAAAIAAVILVVKNWGAITEWFSGVWTTVTTWVSEKVQALKDGIVNAWNNIKTTTSNVWNGIKTTVSNVWNGIKSTVTSIVTGVYNIIKAKFDAAKYAITHPIEAAKTAVQNAINAIKGFFNFTWKLPDLKLPHFSIVGSFSLNPPSVPHLSISWYKKAYGQPMMFRSPTVLATASGLKGFGDGNGGEVVIGQSMMYSMIRGAVADGMNGSTYNNDINIVVNAAPGQDAEEIAEIVSRKINEAVYARRAVFA